jgi:hypothetical protein
MVGQLSLNDLASLLGCRAAFKLLRDNLARINHYYILSCKLAGLNLTNTTKRELSIQLLDNGDLESIVKNVGSMDAYSRKDIISRLLFYKSGFRNCYAAKTTDGKVAHIMWLIYPRENPLIQKNFRRKFYPLKDDEVMIENAFTFPAFRRRGVFPTVMAGLLDIAANDGYKTAIAYVRKDNIASLNEVTKFGFRINKMVKEYKVLGVATRTL